MSRAIGPLASFDESALRDLAPRGAARSFPKNAVVINEGDETDSLSILLSGRAKVFVSEADGREVVLSTIREGDYFGELVLDGGPRSASIMTLEPCRCFVIPLGDIEGLLERNPLFAGHLIHMLIGRVRSLVKKVGDLALKDVYGLAPGRRGGVSRTGLSLAGDNRVHSAGKINKKQPARHAFLVDTATS